MLAVPSAGLLLLAGLGALVVAPLAGAAPRAGGGCRSGLASLAAALCYGLILDASLVLVLGSLPLSFWIALPLSVLGAALAWRAYAAGVSWPPLGPGLAVLVLALLLALIGLRALAEPLANWDARSIWFFHARILFFAQGLEGPLPWADPALAFSHPDYPKLLPILAAQVASGAGLWNEHLPKAALLLLIVPPALGLLGSARHWLPGLGVSVFLLLHCGPLLWNGQADAALALYTALAAAALAAPGGDPAQRALGLGGLGVALLLKNEGQLVALCLLGGGLAVALARRRGSRPDARSLGLAALALLPFLVWRAEVAAWGLASDLALSGESLARAAERAGQRESWALLAASLLPGQGLALLALAIAAAGAALHWLRGPLSPGVAMILGAALLYAAGLVAIYLSTPHDLQWHLQTSALRTPLPVAALLAAALLRLLDELATASRSGAAAPIGSETETGEEEGAARLSPDSPF